MAFAYRNTYYADSTNTVSGISVNAGDFIVVCLVTANSWQGTVFSDTANNPYTSVMPNGGSTYDGGAPYMGYTTARTTATLAITAAVYTGATMSGIVVIVYSNSIPLLPIVDKFAFNTDGSDTLSHTTGSLTTTSPNEVIVHTYGEGDWGQSSPYWTETGSFTARRISEFYGVSDKIVTSIGTYNDTLTSQTAVIWGDIIASFKVSLVRYYQWNDTSSQFNTTNGNAIPVVAGDTIIYVMAGGDPLATVLAGITGGAISATDNNSVGGANTYVAVDAGVGETHNGECLFCCLATAKATATLNLSNNLSTYDNGGVVIVVSGASGLNVKASFTDGSGSNTTHTMTGAATTNANDVIFNIWNNEFDFATDDGSFNTLINLNCINASTGGAGEWGVFYKEVSSTGTYSQTLTTSGGDTMLGYQICLKKASTYDATKLLAIF